MLFKKIFGLDKIYDRKQGITGFTNYIFIIYILFVLFIGNVFTGLMAIQLDTTKSLVPSYFKVGVYIIVVATLAFMLRQVVRTILISNILKKRKYIHITQFPFASRILQSAASNELDTVDLTNVLEEHDNWRLYDATFDFYKKSRNGNHHKVRQAFYTVFEAKLQRPVPHLVFDSKQARGNQFNYIYLQSQRLTLEGMFDSHFETYAPEHYQVDALSFISPEVMQAMIDLKNYDIEFIDDSILCYAPLLDPKDMPAFNNLCQKLYHSVNDNLDTYRDTRVDGAQQLTNFSRRLLNSPRRYMPLLILSSLGIIVLVYLGFTQTWDIIFSRATVGVGILFTTSAGKVISVLRFNDQAKKSFAAEHNSSRA